MSKDGKIMLVGSSIVKIESDSMEVLPDGSEERVVKFRKLKLYSSTGEIGKLSSDVVSDIGGRLPYNEIPLYRDLGAVLATTENAVTLAGTYAYCAPMFSVCRIVGIDQELLKNGKVYVSFYNREALEKTGIPSQVQTAEIKELFPLFDGGVIVDSKTSASAGYIVPLFYKESKASAIGLLSAEKSGNGESQNIHIYMDRIHIPKILLNKRKENTISLLPIKVFYGENAEQQLFDVLEQVESKQFVIGNYVKWKLPNMEDSLVCRIIELPSISTNYYLGIRPLSPNFQGNVTLANGELGVYVNPTSLSYIELGFGGNIMGKTFTVFGIKHENRILDGLKCRVIKMSEIDNQTKGSLKPVSVKKTVMVEFSEDVGGHSGDGAGSPGKCLVIPMHALHICVENQEEIQNVMNEQMKFFITPDAQETVISELEKLEKQTISKNMVKNIASASLDLHNIIGILFEKNHEITLCKGIYNLVLSNGRIVPISSIKFISDIRPFTRKTTYKLREVVQNKNKQPVLWQTASGHNLGGQPAGNFYKTNKLTLTIEDANPIPNIEPQLEIDSDFLEDTEAE